MKKICSLLLVLTLLLSPGCAGASWLYGLFGEEEPDYSDQWDEFFSLGQEDTDTGLFGLSDSYGQDSAEDWFGSLFGDMLGGGTSGADTSGDLYGDYWGSVDSDSWLDMLGGDTAGESDPLTGLFGSLWDSSGADSTTTDSLLDLFGLGGGAAGGTDSLYGLFGDAWNGAGTDSTTTDSLLDLFGLGGGSSGYDNGGYNTFDSGSDPWSGSFGDYWSSADTHSFGEDSGSWDSFYGSYWSNNSSTGLGSLFGGTSTEDAWASLFGDYWGDSTADSLYEGGSSDSWSSGEMDWGGLFGTEWDAYFNGSEGFGGASLADLFDTTGLMGGGGRWQAVDNGSPDDWADSGDKNTTWAFYWYLCGSDLESGHGYASGDLAEMMKVKLPDNVIVVIQTGGAKRWKNNYVDANKIQRWVYQGGKFSLVAEEPDASMGDPRTLASFLDFCNRNFPADHRSVLFWNHGGGSVAGVAFDERHSYDALTLSEMRTAFSAVFDISEQDPPLAMIGFDACLMATVDVAHSFRGMARYLVASEETEPGYGWDYEAWLGQLAANPAMSPAMLGRVICDTYAKGCERQGGQGSMTLSLTDLSCVGPLVDAYQAFGIDALKAATEDPSFYNRFARAAARTENYGGNSREQGYTNMVDMGHLARMTGDMLPSAADVCAALDDCVLYRVNGTYRGEATGLSCYYSYSGSVRELNVYKEQGVGDAFAEYNLYGISGRLSDDGEAYLMQASRPAASGAPTFNTSPQQILTLPETGWDGVKPTVDENGSAVLTLGPSASDVLTRLSFQLFMVDEKADVMLWLGSDNDILADWETGVFRDNFRGVWGSLNGHMVFMELTFEGDDYNLYAVPVLLNGVESHLQIAYDFAEEEWSILGVREGLEDNGMSSKDLRLLRKGDEITILWYVSPFSDEDAGFTLVERETITVDSRLSFSEGTLPDGLYAIMFEMSDAQGNLAYSDVVLFYCDGGDITTYAY